MSNKLYTSDYEHGEIEAVESVHRDYMQDEHLPELKLELQKLDKGSGYFYCRARGEVGDSSYDSCGKQCSEYKPRNGRSGCCKHHRGVYEGTGVFKIIYNTPLKVEVNSET